MALHIPDEHRDPLVRLNNLSRASVDTIVAALKDCKPTFVVENLTKALVKRAKLSQDDARNLMWLLVSLYTVMDSSGYGVDAFLDELIQAAKSQIKDTKTPVLKNWEPLRANLRRLLTLGTLGVSAKALGVMVDHAQVFRNARVISDLRPIFGSDPASKPEAATLVHTLKIDLRTKEAQRAFYVAMDSRDLQILRRAIDRALEKDKALRKVCSASNITFLDVESIERS